MIAYGRFLDIPSDVFRQVIETNLMGQVHGARAALRHFLDQRAGVLINVSSVWGRVSTPYVSPYNLSKHAVRVFSESLRGELAAAKDIHVTSIAPEALDTPIFDHAANYSGHRIRPVPPVLSPQKVAETIEVCAESPRRRGNGRTRGIRLARQRCGVGELTLGSPSCRRQIEVACVSAASAPPRS